MTHRRNDSDGGGWIAALVVISLFFAVILLWYALKFIAQAFAAAPTSPLLWILLVASILFTLAAFATQGNAVAVTLAVTSWAALVVVAAAIVHGLKDNPTEGSPLDSAVHNRWWD